MPFAGAGVSLSVKDGLFPAWSKLLADAADRVRREGKEKEAKVIEALTGVEDYLEAADRARAALAGAWVAFLKERFDPLRPTNADLALPNALWNLGSKLIITTNYDRVLEWARPNVRRLLPSDKASFPSILGGSIERETVWHLHGFIDHPDDIILTFDSYEKLYRNRGYDAAFTALTQQLVTRHFLFVGAAVEDAIQAQFKWVSDLFGGVGGPHYALVLKGQEGQFKGVETIAVDTYGKPLLAVLREMASHVGTGADVRHEVERPDRDTLISRVGDVYRVRGWMVEPFSRPGVDYLRVTTKHGECFPVGVGPASSLAAFEQRVVRMDYDHSPAVFVHDGSGPPANAVPGVRVQSFTGLQDALIDFRPYLDKLERRLDDARYPSDLFIPQEISYWLGRERRVETDALEAVWERVTAPKGGFTVVLGDFGTGKSFLLRQVARRLMEEKRITPLLIDLRRLNRQDSLHGLLATHLAQEEQKDFALGELEYMIREGRVALLFDGYDELELRVGYEGAAEHFETICAAAGGNARVVVTSRTQHFKSDDQVLQQLGRRAETEQALLMTLEKFDRVRSKACARSSFGTRWSLWLSRSGMARRTLALESSRRPARLSR